MQEKITLLKTLLNEIADLKAIDGLLSWDQLVNMPNGASGDRSVQVAALEKLKHQKSTSLELGQLLEELTGWLDDPQADSDVARLVKVAKRNFDKQTKVPEQFVVEFARISSEAQNVWDGSKKNADFDSFLPYLAKLVGLRRQYANFFQPWEHVYDPLLDDFEPGMKTAEMQQIFNQLRPKQVALVRAIAEKPQVRNDFLYRDFNINKQELLGRQILTDIGYDWNYGRQDCSAHPFTVSMGLNDVRITTRYENKYLPTGLFASMHECGHALYELGIEKKYNRTPLAEVASLAVHESQSRMWENLIGRSWPFWQRYYPALQKTFYAELADVDSRAFYEAVNAVQPSFIRMQADEATYNLHIMLRMELEIALMEGTLAAQDAPDAWNAKMEEYLGIKPEDDSQGILQDVHWAFGGFGYFPTYALGNLISVQLWDVIRKEIPDVEHKILQGKFGDILEWLGARVHTFGAKYEPQELIKKVTGSPISPEPYIRYLEVKFSEIYHL